MDRDIRQRIVKGFTHSYLRIEQKMVVEYLRSGRIGEDTWNTHVEALNDVMEEYRSGDLDPEDFLEQREGFTQKIRKLGHENVSGVTKEDAINLYEPFRDKHEDVLREAHQESTSILKIVYKTVSNKISLTFIQLKNI